VDFTVARGAVCGLVGPNGSGKSTTLRILAGLSRPDRGRVEIVGMSAAEAARRGRIGYLPDSPGLPGFMRGRALLIHLARLAGMAASAAERAAQGALEQTGLLTAAERRVGEYSKGMRQRLGLAQALLGDPEVLLLDEPVSGLDPRAVDHFGWLVRALGDRGRTVLFTSHFLPQVEEICDDVVLLEHGRVLAVAGNAAVRAAGGLHRLYLDRVAS
jgi:ABC-type multidrug transport system ATPase subunit